MAASVRSGLMVVSTWRSGTSVWHGPVQLAPTADQWQAVRAAITALNTALEPIVQPLTAGEIQDLLRVGIANEALTRDYVALIEAHPNLFTERW